MNRNTINKHGDLSRYVISEVVSSGRWNNGRRY